ncbi:MAG: thrombospondin type 3 repeat-containing protein [Myxococcota bacterium]
MLRFLISLALASVACSAPGSPGTTDPIGTLGPTSTTSTEGPYQGDGIVFKGPMAEGTEVSVQSLNPGLQPVGEPTVSLVGTAGRYVATGRGLVLIETTGAPYDEARGAFPSQPLSLSGYGELNEDSAAVQLTLLTDLSRPRVAELVAQGRTFAEATVEAETAVALALGLPKGPDRGSGSPIFAEGDESAWLFATSSIVAQVGLFLEREGTGSLASYLDDLRNAFLGGNTPDANLQGLFDTAQTQLDPALPRLGLSELQRVQSTNETVPDFTTFLDTDLDGVPNSLDVCPFVPDPLQVDSANRGWGDACDTPITALSISDGFGCALLATDGSLACWRDDAPVLGGVPPHPRAFPTSTEAPWGDGPGLDGTGYLDVALGPGIACASTANGVTCADGQDVWAVDLGNDRVDLSVMGSRVCSLDDEGNATCLDHGGGGAIVMPVNAQDIAPFGANGVCVRDQDQLVSCFDATTGDGLAVALPPGPFLEIDGTQGGNAVYGCGIATGDGTIVCWGDAPPGVPKDSGYRGIATGVGLACAERTATLPTCWRDPAVCPAVPEGELRLPAVARRLSVEDCVVGGIGGDGLGYAWPRYWFRRPGAVP